MRQRLEAFDDLALRYERSTRPGDYVGDSALYEQLHRAEPTVKQILRLLDPLIGAWASWPTWTTGLPGSYQMHPPCPPTSSTPGCGSRAAPLWGAEARQDAVLAAARTVNYRLQ